MLPHFGFHNEVLSSKINVSQVIAVKCLRNIRGASRPAIVECSDGNLYIVKTRDTPRGPSILVNEFVGGMLCVALGFSVPTPYLVEITDAFLSKTPALLPHLGRDSWHPMAGIQYGTRFVGDAFGIRATVQYVPSRPKRVVHNQPEFLGIYLFDLWANHHNRRQRLFVTGPNTTTHNAVFIDNGLLFGGSEQSFHNEHRQTLYRSQDRLHFAWSSDAAERWIEHFRRTIPFVLRKAMMDVPSEWRSCPMSHLEDTLLDRLEHLEELVDKVSRMVPG